MAKFYDIITREAEMFDGSPEMCEKYGIMRLESKISNHYTRIVYACDGWQPAIGDYLEKNSVAVSAIPLRLRDNELPVVPSCVDRYIRDHKAQNWTLEDALPANDDMYYELTYNGDKDELHLDAYKKQENIPYTIMGDKIPLD